MNEREARRLERQIALIGEEACLRLSESSVLVAGIGGVGGHAAEALCRMGVGSITLVDNDRVSESNINRQLIATYETVGELKVEVMERRLKSINPDCRITALPLFITRDNAAEIINGSGADAVLDAVDNVTAKLAMVCAAHEQGRYIFSCMGAGNKLCGAGCRVADIYGTSVCGLARVMRRELKKRGIESLDVIYSEELPVNQGGGAPSSIAYMPAIAGLMAAEQVVKRLMKRK